MRNVLSLLLITFGILFHSSVMSSVTGNLSEGLESEQVENVVISVKDSGVGIDENILKQPFDAFYTTKKEGLGMGLSISKSIIEDHGGRLWITKNQDRGVTVSFTVPVSKENLR